MRFTRRCKSRATNATLRNLFVSKDTRKDLFRKFALPSVLPRIAHSSRKLVESLDQQLRGVSSLGLAAQSVALT